MPKLGKLKVIPSVLGRLYSSHTSRPRLSFSRARGNHHSRTYPICFILPSAPHARMRRHKPPGPDGEKLDKPQNAAFAHADKLYQELTQEQRKLWHDAVKKPHMTGYDLWMKENLSHLLQGYKPSLTPSTSGGWSCKHLPHNGTLPYPECALSPGFKRIALTFHKRNYQAAGARDFYLEWLTAYSQPPLGPWPGYICYQTPRPLFRPPAFYSEFWNACESPKEYTFRAGESVQCIGLVWHLLPAGFYRETRFVVLEHWTWTWANAYTCPIQPPPYAVWQALRDKHARQLP